MVEYSEFLEEVKAGRITKVEIQGRSLNAQTADGKRIFMGVLEPGDKKLISTLQNTKMVVGNAGGIAVSKGGRDIGPIGPRGQVRTVNITEKGVEIVEPKKPTDAI